MTMECKHLTLEHNGEEEKEIRWTCKDCGKQLTIEEVQEWMKQT